MDFSKRKKNLLILCGAVVLLFFVQRWVFSGRVVKWRGLDSQIRLEEEKLKKGLVIQKDKERITRDYKEYSVYLSSVSQEKDIAAEFLREIENISKVSGVSVVSMNPDSQPEISDEAKIFKAQLRLDTDMEKLLILLDKIETSKLLIKINKISITRKDEESAILSVEASLTMAVPLE